MLAGICAALNCGVLPFWKYSFEGTTAEPMLLYGFGNFGRGALLGTLFWLFNATLALSVALPAITSCLFSNRKLQATLVTISIGVAVSAIVFAVFSALLLQSKLGSSSVTNMPQLGLLLLVLSPIFLLLSRGGILKDEEIATAYKRL